MPTRVTTEYTTAAVASCAGCSRQLRDELDPREARTARPRPARRRAARGRGGRRAAAATRPIARHGFSAWKTSPKITLANAIPTQNVMNTKIAREVRERVVGAEVAGADRGREQQDAERAADDLDRLGAEHARRPGAGATRAAPAAAWTTGRRAPRRTRRARPPPARQNSHSGIGRFARWTSPCACARSAPSRNAPAVPAATAQCLPPRVSGGSRRRPGRPCCSGRSSRSP